MIQPEKENGMEFGFPDFLKKFLFIYFRQLNDELDKHNEKIFWQRKLQLEYNSPEKKKFILLTIFLKITGKNQSSLTAIQFLNKLDLQQ